MGLDMYLYKKHYVQNWDHMSPEEKHEITIKKGGKSTPHINSEKIVYIIEQVGYWRKANAVHQWFVENVQKGEDDCREYYLERSDLQKLLKICKKIKDGCILVDGKVGNGYTFNEKGEREYNYIDGKTVSNPEIAEELLPSCEGFFFGSTDYDQYYMEDIENTIKILETELRIKYPKGFGSPEYYYRASW